jgi:hypothetical protein
VAERKDTPGTYLSWQFKGRTLLLVGRTQVDLAEMVAEAQGSLDNYNPVMLCRRGRAPIFYTEDGKPIQ